MSSKRENLLAAVDTVLKTMSSVVSASVYRSRMAAFHANEFPAVVLAPTGDNPTQPNIAKVDWDFLFSVQVGVRAAMNQIPDQIADPILVEVYDKIMNSSTINDLLIERAPGRVAWKIDDADLSICWATMQFAVKYRTNLADLTTA